jgi:predicted deacylase
MVTGTIILVKRLDSTRITETAASLQVGGRSIAAGERCTVYLPVANLYTNTELTMPVHVLNGEEPGPTLFLTGALHGDELNGVEIIKQVIRQTPLRRLRGCLLAVPVVNVFGFINRSRYLPDRRDLNRSFPGRDSGSIAARLANLLAEEVLAKADFGIDLHTGAVNRTNFPQIRANLDDPQTRRLALAFGAPVVIDAALREGSLRQFAAEKGVQTLVYESGEALRFDELSIRVGVNGIARVMRTLGMLPERKRAEPPAEPLIARSTTWVRAPVSGMFRTRGRLGDRVEKGQLLGRVSDPFGEVIIDVCAPVGGLVIGRSTSPLAHEGDALFHIARLSDDADTDGAVDALQETHSVEYIWG